jgi:hypothetical protein
MSDTWKKYGTPDFKANQRIQVKRGFCKGRKKKNVVDMAVIN